MDRNNFLFCGHKITLLKILTAIGKLNTKLISVIKAKLELSYCTVINNHLRVCLADVSVYLYAETDRHWTDVYNCFADQKESYLLYNKSFRDNFPFFKTTILKYHSLEVVNLLPNGMDGSIHNPITFLQCKRLYSISCYVTYELDENVLELSFQKNIYIKKQQIRNEKQIINHCSAMINKFHGNRSSRYLYLFSRGNQIKKIKSYKVIVK